VEEEGRVNKYTKVELDNANKVRIVEDKRKRRGGVKDEIPTTEQ
jgi:hypothetical protein